MTADLMIDTRRLTKVFGNVVAVNGLDLAVPIGAIHGLVGPNGSGKTTTMKMLAGAIRCTNGRGFIKGYPIGSREARRLIGYLVERPSVYGDMTALDYLVFLGGMSGLGRHKAQDKAANLLDYLRLADSARRKTREFSAGMKQRLGLAQALIHDPELLLLDEPTANLDPGGRMWLADELRRLSHERGVTVLISSHVLPEIEQLASSVSFMNRGSLVAESALDRLDASAPQTRYALDTSNNKLALEMVKDKPYLHRVTIDDKGILHLEGVDSLAMQTHLLADCASAGIVVRSLDAEPVRLADLYRRVMGPDEG